MNLRPTSEIRISRHLIPAWKRVPNTSVQNKPLLIYHDVVPRQTPTSSSVSASDLSSHLQSVGVVVPQWQYTMYSQSHFHSTSHEVLGVIGGRAKLCFGGEENPGRVEPIVEPGDLIIVPAGVAHRLLEDQSGGGFKMLGCYPPGKEWDMCYGAAGEEAKIANISELGWFDKDPLYGIEGPAVKV